MEGKASSDSPMMRARKKIRRDAQIAMGVVMTHILPFWVINWIPSLPPSVLRYGAIEYFCLVPIYLFNLLVACYSTTNDFYLSALLLNVASLPLEILLLVGLGHSFYTCTQGIAPSSCTGNYVMDILATYTSLLLICMGVSSVYHFFFIVTSKAKAD
jgi:hypothetical protein